MSAASQLLDALHAVSQTGRLGTLIIERWIGGGQPPPYYRSEQLRLRSGDLGLVAESATLRFAPQLTPNDVIESVTRPISLDIARNVARELIAAKVFESTFAAEKDPGRASPIRYHFTLSLGDDKLEKTFYLAPPEELAAVQATFDKLAEDVRAVGARRWLHQGKPIANPFSDKS